ncbi:MAG: LysR family transcriptional regulator [Gammaproteobacteria bacterium]|nr:LysR family transcriptional regulator [Gammaproteobacteria bacterium]
MINFHDLGNKKICVMRYGPYPLPPLKTLPAFEASARLLSFTRAADELALTQGAISRQIGNLEERLGTALFERSKRTLKLTPAGQYYAEAVTDALKGIALATEGLREKGDERPVTIGATNALASLWLMPRLNRYRAHDPDLPIRVLASDFDLPEASGDVDLVISYSRTPPPEPNACKLFDEVVFPVCSPELIEAHGEIGTLEELLCHTLLIHDDDHPDWTGWAVWLKAMGRAGFKPRRAVRFNAYSMLLQAAVANQGIALGWQHLVDDLLAAGSLIKLDVGDFPTAGAFYLRPVKPIVSNARATPLREWLIDSGAQLSDDDEGER